MIDSSEKNKTLELISEAVKKGASITKSCELLNISIRSYQRWIKGNIIDKRKGSTKNVANKLTDEEKEEIVSICCNNRFKDMNPYEIVAILAEENVYLASESTFYRILKERGLLNHRTNDKVRQKRRGPEELKATGPNQVWSWDITYLKSEIQGKYYFLYLFVDIWSRMITGWGIYEEESEENVVSLLAEICKRKNLTGIKLRSDNGAVMKSAHVLSTLHFLGVTPSFSRPRVSNDNPYSESLFRTVKYTVGYPGHFSSLENARNWMIKFEKWYNYCHRHSKIGYVTPNDRDNGNDIKKFEARNRTMEEAFKKHPERFKGKVRKWVRTEAVYINKSAVSLTA